MKCIIYSVRIIKQNSISVDIVGKLQTAIGIMHAQFRPDILYLGQVLYISHFVRSNI